MQNSQNPVHASFDISKEDQNYNPGLTKIEHATVELLAAHLKAHGRMPDSSQVMALIELAAWTLDHAIPVKLEELYPPVHAEGHIDPEKHLEELE